MSGEARNPNIEIRNKSEIRSTNVRNADVSVIRDFGDLNLFGISDLEFRICRQGTKPPDCVRGVGGLDRRRALIYNRLVEVTRVETANFDHILKTLKGRKPYRPFTVALVNGDRFEVDHPDALVVRDGAAAYIAAGGVPVLFDHEGVGQLIGDLMDQSDT